MPRIVNNRICYSDHNVVLCEKLWAEDRNFAGNYLMDMADHLTEHGRAGAHRRELEGMNNDGSWTIELPTITLQPQYNREYQERHPTMYIPNKMLCMIGLHNGNYHKVIFVAEALRTEGARKIWTHAYQSGFKIGKAQRRVAEAQYEAAYVKAVEAYKTANGLTIASFDPVI